MELSTRLKAQGSFILRQREIRTVKPAIIYDPEQEAEADVGGHCLGSPVPEPEGANVIALCVVAECGGPELASITAGHAVPTQTGELAKT